MVRVQKQGYFSVEKKRTWTVRLGWYESEQNKGLYNSPVQSCSTTTGARITLLLCVNVIFSTLGIGCTRIMRDNIFYNTFEFKWNALYKNTSKIELLIVVQRKSAGVKRLIISICERLFSAFLLEIQNRQKHCNCGYLCNCITHFVYSLWKVYRTYFWLRKKSTTHLPYEKGWVQSRSSNIVVLLANWFVMDLFYWDCCYLLLWIIGSSPVVSASGHIILHRFYYFHSFQQYHPFFGVFCISSVMDSWDDMSVHCFKNRRGVASCFHCD